MTEETNGNKCKRVDEGNGRFICHSCRAFWFESGELGPDWRPMACPDYKKGRNRDDDDKK